MPKPLNQQEFVALQTATNAERRSLKTSQSEFQAARANLAKAKSDLQAELALGVNANAQNVANLNGQINDYQGTVNSLQGSIGEIEGNIYELLDEILFELDPRALVGFLDDAVPIFMMPLRVETRFMTVKHIARIAEAQMEDLPRPDLIMQGGNLVRVPKTVEVRDAFVGYTEMPVIEDSHELWVRVFPDDIAIHTHEEALTQIELDAGKAFWTNIWYAGPDEALRIGAWRGLVSGRGSERGAWVANQTRPTNNNLQPTTTTAPTATLSPEPIFPTLVLKESTWTEMPHSRVMPDRIVVRVYNGTSYREVVGRPVPDPLPLSLDPADFTNTIDTAGGDLKLPDKLRWMQDFEAAEEIGMGIRIPLSPSERTSGFSKIIVAGVKTSADEAEGKDLLEDLIQNHHYTKTGISIIPQGTPTNNTDDAAAGHSEDTSDDESLFEIEMGEDLFTPSTDPKKRADGQYLADALGIDYEAVAHLKNADYTDVKEAMCMNTALWPTTLGYYLRNLLHPVFTKTEIAQAKSHFNTFVLGRGKIPAIRVGSQPYGILATTAFSKLQYGTTSGQEGLLSKMHTKLLTPMSGVWDGLAQQVSRAGQSVPPAEKNEQFLDIIGLHPSSVEFYQRFASGSYFLWNLYNYSKFIQGATSPAIVSYANSLQFATAFAGAGISSIHSPRVFDLTYINEHKFLNGPVIDRLKFSETRPLEAMGTNQENYIDWLIQSNWDQIRQEDFTNIGLSSNAVPPKALLYLMLRHSALLEYVQTSMTMLANNNLVSENALLDHELVNYTLQASLTPEMQNLFKANIFVQEAIPFENGLDAQVEQEFITLANEGALNGITLEQFEGQKADYRADLKSATEGDFLGQVDQIFNAEVERLMIPGTKVGLLSEAYPFMTSGETLHEFVFDKIWGSPFDQDVKEMQELVAAMTCLKGLPTARLERCFAEHIDLASYRLDAWFTSLASQRLAKQRAVESNRKTGIHIGAYGWLENVKPNADFPGIHYEEVDVQPTIIRVPGFSTVDTSAIGNSIPLQGVHIWGELNPAAVQQLAEPTASQQNIEGVVFGREIPLAPVYEQYEFLARPATEFTGLSYASTKALAVNSTLREVAVDQPWPILSSEALFSSPMCIYLGSGTMGDIMLDPVKNKFIHVPRVDAGNQGYIHAPSINQATAAAVLRAGYASHSANPGSPDDALAVNLSSARVRRAKFYLEGLKNGQELGALLGYQFERGLHDSELYLDGHILEFRLKFPLVAGRVSSNGSLTNISDAESYNVVNGLELIETSTTTAYPYGVSGLPGSGSKRDAIIAEVDRMHDALDAINDLLMSEAMYQVTLGNHPRAGSALNALSGKGIPADPQIIETPRSFHVVTHRTGVQFDLSADGHKMWTANGTARSVAEPGLNRWLSTVLPPKTGIVFNYGYRMVAVDGSLGSLIGGTANAGHLDLEPIDLYYILSQPSEKGDAVELVQRIGWYVQRDVVGAANVQVEIAFEDRTGMSATDVTLNELHPLMVELRSMVGSSRAINAKDNLLASNAEAHIAANPTSGVLPANLTARLTDTASATMSNGQRGLAGVILDLTAAIPPVELLIGTTGVTSITDLDALAAALKGAAAFGVSNAYPVITESSLDAVGQAMVDQANRSLTIAEARASEASDEMANAALATVAESKISALTKAAHALYGRVFRVFPEYQVYNPLEVDASIQYPDYLNHAGPEAIDEWLQSLSPVRKRIQAWHRTGLLSEALTGQQGILDLSLAQFPLLPLDTGGNPEVRWLGVEFPTDYDIPDEVLSLVYQLPTAYTATGVQAGILIDEWTEEIPMKKAHTGIAVHYNNPDSEPAQTCLLAISPNETGAWSWDDVMDTVVETLEWAKKRAVDPDQMNTTLFAQVLPATYAAISGTDDSPTLDYGRNIIQRPVSGMLDMIKIKDFLA